MVILYGKMNSLYGLPKNLVRVSRFLILMRRPDLGCNAVAELSPVDLLIIAGPYMNSIGGPDSLLFQRG